MRSKHLLPQGKEFQISYDKRVSKFLLRHPDVRKKFKIKEKYLRQGDFKSLDVKKLQGNKSDFRLRIGKYRFLFVVKDQELMIYFYTAGSRGGVY